MIYRNGEGKLRAIVREIAQFYAIGRPNAGGHYLGRGLRAPLRPPARRTRAAPAADHAHPPGLVAFERQRFEEDIRLIPELQPLNAAPGRSAPQNCADWANNSGSQIRPGR